MTLLTGCSHYYYAPNAHNVPLLKEKKDTKILLALSSGDEFSGFEGQFATAVTDKVGIMANFFTASSSEEDSNESGKGSMFEIGAGYFKPLGQRFVFESYGGVGYGGVSNKYEIGSSKVKFSKIFVQPAIGFSTKGFEAILSTRLAGLNYHSVNYQAVESYDLLELQYVNDHKFSVLFEPALTIRGGWNKLKIQLQYVISSNISNPELQQEIQNLNLGLHIDISPTK